MGLNSISGLSGTGLNGLLFNNLDMKVVNKHGNKFDLYRNIYVRKFYRMAASMFVWENLPNGIQSTWLENQLTTNGSVAFFEDPQLGYVFTPGGQGGNLNIYGQPVVYNAIGFNYSKQIKVDASKEELDRSYGVIIGNDINYEGFGVEINTYAEDLAQIKQYVDVNLGTTATPWLIQATPKTRLSLVTAFKKAITGDAAIVADKNLDPDSLKVLNLNAPYNVDKLRDEYSRIENEFMTTLGISNADNAKKERMLVDEVNANNGQININAKARLDARQAAVETINARFGLDIKVSLADNIQYDTTPLEGTSARHYPATPEGGTDDGEVHD